MSWKSKVRKWLRILHRDIGYFMVGISLIYGISGLLINHMGGESPSHKTIRGDVQLEAQLTQEELMLHWNDQSSLPEAKKILPIDDSHFRILLDGGIGVYEVKNGVADYEQHTKRQFAYWINQLHYNKVKGWSIMGDLFAISLLFFALSGLFMVRGKNGIAQRGKWFLLVGLLIPILFILFS